MTDNDIDTSDIPPLTEEFFSKVKLRMPSTLASVGYDPDTQSLEVEFLHSGIYQYSGVPTSVYDGLMTADSHGSYFDIHIKKAGYGYQKVC